MAEITHLLSKLNQAELLPVQQIMVLKLTKVPFAISKNTTYEPLLDLLEFFFITEYPTYYYAKEIAQIFYDSEVKSIHSNYRYFQHEALWYLSFMSEDAMKRNVYEKLTEKSDPMLHEKRLKRIQEETHLKSALEKYRKATDDVDYFYLGTAVISKTMQILVHPIEDEAQKERLNLLIVDMVSKLRVVLPKLKTV